MNTFYCLYNSTVLFFSKKQKLDTQLLETTQKTEKLDKLCRALQEERTKMLVQLKEPKDKIINQN